MALSFSVFQKPSGLLMRKPFLLKISVAAIVILLVIGWVLFSEWREPEEKKTSPSLKIVPEKVDVKADDVFFTEVGRGDVRYEIRAKTVTYQKKDNTADLEDVRVKIIMPSRQVYTITADRGSYDTNKKDISMTGHVAVKSDDGTLVTTDRLFYTDAEKKIHTTSPVTMINRDIEVRGVGLRLFVDKRQLTLLSQVKATISSRQPR
jgi:LPS export ABC transporter protein LptC